MEKFISKQERKNRSVIKGALAALGLCAVLLSSGCGEDKSETPATAITVEQILSLEHSARIHPGESVLVEPISSEQPRTADIVDGLPIVSHIYPHGISDENAPTISEKPQRLKTQVTLHGDKSNYLDQDGACDTLNIAQAEKVTAIGALSIGNEDQLSIVSWPNEVDGTNGNQAYVCVFQNSEPSEGIILFTQL